jgi:ribosomal protein S18 acetylase RimI-like enzyme
VSTTITIAPAGLDEAAELSVVGQASFRQAYESWSEPADLQEHLDEFFSESAVRDAMATPGCKYLMARNGSEAAGFVKIRDSEKPDRVPVAKAFELQQVYVDPEQQRYGIGGRLLESARHYAAEQSADGVWLTVWEDAMWAVNCYRKYGFEQVGMIDFKLGKTVYNDILMWLPVKG